MFDWQIDTPVDRILGEAIGAASMCWNPVPEGVFDSRRASQITDELLAMLKQKLWVDRRD
jgi:hypothetical protein